MYFLKKRFLLLTVLALTALGWLTNSCKKENQQATITDNLVRANGWQLASLQRLNYSGDTLKKTDTLNTTCKYTQTVSFNTNGTYAYNNYSCLSQTTNGNWQFSSDYLVLISGTTFKDTSSTLKTPFRYARIVNLGRNSLVLQQTDTLTNRGVVPIRYTITRYGFIHI